MPSKQSDIPTVYGDIINLNGFDSLVGQDCTVSFIGLGLVGFNGLIGHISLVGFDGFRGGRINIGNVGLISLARIIGLVGHTGLIGLVLGHISLISLVGLIGFISLVGLVSFCHNGLIGKGIIVNSLQFEIEMKQSQLIYFLGRVGCGV
jgi:hypothetical protein